MQDPKSKSKKRFSFEHLFASNLVVMAVAVLISVVMWAVLASSGEPDETTYPITDLPVEAALAESLGLEIITGDDRTVTVNVRCSPFMVSRITKNDIVVSAQTGELIEPGSYPVQLTARKVNNALDFEIVSVEPGWINLKIDRMDEKDFKVANSGIKFSVQKGDYYAAEVILDPGTITISGPQTELAKIKRVEAVGFVEGELAETKSITASIVLYDYFDNAIDYTTANLELDYLQVSAQIPILYEKTLPVQVNYLNGPVNTAGLIKVDPMTIKVGAPKSAFDKYPNIPVEGIDFSTIKPGVETVFEFPVILPTSFKNRSDNENISVEINMEGYETKVFNVTSFQITGQTANNSYTIKTEKIPVTVVGPAEMLSGITDSDISGIIDVSTKTGFSGQTEIPVKFSIKNGDKCWIFGDYPATVQIS